VRGFVVSLFAGFLLAGLIAGIPALASDKAIVATATNTWDPANVDIDVGNTVTWSNPNSGAHNVCVYKPGSSGSSCDEFTNGVPDTDWSGRTNSHQFTTAGTYHYYCQFHGTSMGGTITVGGSGGTTTTGTGTSTTPPPNTQPTDTITVPTNTDTTPADTTAPAFTGKLKRRSSRTKLILDLGSSEDAELKATVFRRAPGKKSFSRVGSATVDVAKGRNKVTLPRKAAGRLRAGAYRVMLQLEDAAGNRSAKRVLVFKLA